MVDIHGRPVARVSVFQLMHVIAYALIDVHAVVGRCVDFFERY
jgi:hypothetical protein